MPKLCSLASIMPKSIAPAVQSWSANRLEQVLAISEINRLYSHLPQTDSPLAAVRAMLDMFNANWQIAAGDISSIPRQGPVIVVANHPFGAIEGLFVADMLGRLRPDIRLMANYLLGGISEIRELFFLVNPFGGGDALRQNLSPLRQALAWLKNNGLLVIFPAGEVAHYNHQCKMVVEPPWIATVGRLVQHSRATVVPLHIVGRNSGVFQTAGLIHPRLRTALLPRELIKKRGCTVPIHVGRNILFSEISHISTAEKLTAYLRLRCQMLRPTPVTKNPRPVLPFLRRRHARLAPLISPVARPSLVAEINMLPVECRLCQSGSMTTFLAEADEIPHLLREIGRLRELSFRAAQEGTGRELDLDLFDNFYQHLFIWNHSTEEIVGGYRLGRTDMILPRRGIRGLYSGNLFNYRRQFFDNLGPAIELGRSFVVPSYQKSYAPLLMLWRGIGEVMAQQPHYRTLFGPVSISCAYSQLSGQIIRGFAAQLCADNPLRKWVKPRHDVADSSATAPDIGAVLPVLRNLDDLSILIRVVEPDRKDIPVLVRHYMALGGQMLAFSRDPAFSNVVDGLVVVDLRRAERRQLIRYMGRTGAENFLAYHNSRSSAIVQNIIG